MSERIRAALAELVAVTGDVHDGSDGRCEICQAVAEARSALAEPETAAEGRKSLPSALDVVLEQAGMESLWFVAEHIFEDHLQQELRRLHEAVERDDQEANKGASGSGGK